MMSTEEKNKLLKEYDDFINGFASAVENSNAATYDNTWATVQYKTKLTDDEVNLITHEIGERAEGGFNDPSDDEIRQDCHDFADIVFGGNEIVIVENAEDSNHEKGFYTYDEACALIDAYGKENGDPVIFSPYEIGLIVNHFPVYGKDYIEGEDDEAD